MVGETLEVNSGLEEWDGLAEIPFAGAEKMKGEQIKPEVFDARELPLSDEPALREVQEKFLRGEELTLKEKMLLGGRDWTVKEVDGYKLKPDCAYRSMSMKEFLAHQKSGFVESDRPDDEYMEWEEDGRMVNNNRGVDWYLGGACLKYGRGEVVVEAPARKDLFQLAFRQGTGMAIDPTVRFMKSSGGKNPVPMSLVKVIRMPKTDADASGEA